MRPTTTLRDALEDPRLLAHVLVGETWRPWRILLIAAMGEPLTDEERPIFTKLTDRAREPLQRVNELEVVAGRRAGKTTAMAAFATYLATCCDHTDALARGETGVLLCVAQDQRVAKKVLDFVESYLADSEILRQLVKGRTADTIELANSISIEVRPASFRRLRGPTYIAVICDELAFWYVGDEYVNPDDEIIAAAKPGLLTTRGPLIMASSPYAKRGVLWDVYRQHYGPDGSPSVLVAKGTTRDFNETIPQQEIDRELERDPARNRAELLAEFRSDIAAFVDRTVVEKCITYGVRERSPDRKLRYHGFVDPSGGSRDSFTLCIGHYDRRRQAVSIDCLRERRPPFSPEVVTEEYAKLLRSYRVYTVVGDRYGGEWPREQFRKFGVNYQPADKPKSELYIDTLPLINSCRLELLDEPRSINQLCNLECRTARSGRDTIDHPPNGQDDCINAIAGCAAILAEKGGYDPTWGCGNEENKQVDLEEARRQRITKVFGSLEAAEAYKQRQRALYGRSVSFPWDTRH